MISTTNNLAPAAGRSLSLYEIEDGLTEVIAAAEDATTDEERAAAAAAIRAYLQEEIRKVDSVRAYLRHCDLMVHGAKAEEERQRELKHAWQNRKMRLKQACEMIMTAFGLKRIEGRTGNLLLKGNGGQQALKVTNETILPEEYWDYTIAIPGQLWATFRQLCPFLVPAPSETERTYSEDRIRHDLEAGTPVPGAYLEERGQHLEVR